MAVIRNKPLRRSRRLLLGSWAVGHWSMVVTLCLVVVGCHKVVQAQQESSPLTMNGGSVLAMAGKNCVAIAVDKRFGSGPALVQIAPPPLLVASPTLLVACTGLQTDVQSLQQDLTAQITRTCTRGLGFHTNERQQQERSTSLISPRALASLTSHILYRRKRSPYYVEPLVVGLEKVVRPNKRSETKSNLEFLSGRNQEDVLDGRITDEEEEAVEGDYRPYLCSFDMIGARSVCDSFVCAGAAAKSLYGTAEGLWKENLSPTDLVRLCGEAFLSAIERDSMSGYGALVYLITADGGIIEYDLDTRND